MGKDKDKKEKKKEKKDKRKKGSSAASSDGDSDKKRGHRSKLEQVDLSTIIMQHKQPPNVAPEINVTQLVSLPIITLSMDSGLLKEPGAPKDITVVTQQQVPPPTPCSELRALLA